jgi:hypothetical protein
MTVQVTDNNAGTPAPINPGYVISLRLDAEDPLHVTDVKLEDGEEASHPCGAHGGRREARPAQSRLV